MVYTVSQELSKILFVHNTYQQRGGEDGVVENEISLLRSLGKEVSLFSVSNSGIEGGLSAARSAFALLRGGESEIEADLDERIRTFKPELIHLHNVFPRIGEGAYRAAERSRIPVVQTIHNYRFSCANALFLRDGKPCENCLRGSLSNAVRYACYRNSRLASATVAAWIGKNRRASEIGKRARRIIALTRFAGDMLVEAGVPAHKLRIKANYVPDEVGRPAGRAQEASGVLFVGRISPEKGVQTLLEVARQLPELPFTIIGDGPLRTPLQERARGMSNVHWLGALPAPQVQVEMAKARILLFPSILYEGFPMVLGEAFAVGLPVVCSRIGGLPEIVGHEREGVLAPPGDAAAFAREVQRVIDDPAFSERLSRGARARYETTLARGPQSEALLKIYSEALAGS